MQIDLHIGYHKTASTSLQAFCVANQAALAAEGILYPQTGRAGDQHGALANSFKAEATPAAQQTAAESLLLEAKTKGFARLLVSSECFVEAKEVPANLARWLPPDQHQIRVLVYLRRQDDWIQSVYNEVTKDRYRRFDGDLWELRELRQGFADYQEMIQLWANAFGSSAITLRPFETGQFPPGGVYEDFCQAWGWEFSRLQLPLDEKNKSMQPDFIEFLRRCNRIRFTQPEHQRLVTALQALSDQDPNPNKQGLLTLHQKRELLRNFAPGNQALARQYLGREELFLAPLPTEAEAYGGLSSQRERQILKALPQQLQALIFARHPAAQSSSGESCLPPAYPTEAERLRASLIRHRWEWRHLYEGRG